MSLYIGLISKILKNNEGKEIAADMKQCGRQAIILHLCHVVCNNNLTCKDYVDVLAKGLC